MQETPIYPPVPPPARKSPHRARPPPSACSAMLYQPTGSVSRMFAYILRTRCGGAVCIASMCTVRTAPSMCTVRTARPWPWTRCSALSAAIGPEVCGGGGGVGSCTRPLACCCCCCCCCRSRRSFHHMLAVTLTEMKVMIQGSARSTASSAGRTRMGKMPKAPWIPVVTAALSRFDEVKQNDQCT